MKIVRRNGGESPRIAELARGWLRLDSDRLRSLCMAVLCVATVAGSDCGIAGSPPTSPPPSVTVTIGPKSASVLLGATQQFQATVTGTSDTTVSWEVNGVVGGDSAVGTIATTGAGTATYTAPLVLPSPPSVTVTAVSQADSSANDSASVMLSDNVTITVSPPTASVPTGGEQVFTASVAGLGGGASGVAWSVNGIAGGNATVGTIASTGATTALYTAPSIPPNPATVTITATSNADSSKTGSAATTITCSATDSISPPSANVGLGQTQTFSASFCLAAGTNAAWDVHGIPGGNSTVGTIVSTGQETALYTAPADLPAADPLTIHATAPADITATSTVTVISSVSVSVAPPTATLAISQRMTFTPTVMNTTDTTVTWTVNGIASGNTAVGQVCQMGSNPCVAPAGAASGSVDFVAPQSVPATNPVVLTATSRADPSRSGSATIEITNATGPVAVTISPPYAFIAPSNGTPSTQQFFATVTGAANTSVSWSVQSVVSGQGCAGAACGSVDASGLYTAPSAAPSPNAISVIATSQADSTKSASATLAITSGPAIETILPSSVMAGAVESFPLEVEGVNFVAGSGSSASVILLNGASRSTTCASTTACTTSINPSDVQTNGTISVQVQNPGVPAELSNPVPFVIVPFDVSVGTISLSSTQPTATGENIVVVEPTTAAASAPINVNFVGYLTGGNTCGAQGSPLAATRPAAGSATTSLCIQGNNLEPTFTYAFTGPGAPPGGSDIGVTASAIAGLFPGMIELDLQISNTTAPGVRTLIITTLNNDCAVATGMLEVQ
jgi:hypothetical protein